MENFKSIETQYVVIERVMSKTSKKADGADNKLVVKYQMLSKIFIIISILFIVWISFIALGIFILELEPNWAFLYLENWIISWCVLTLIFIILEVIFYVQFISKTNKRVEFKESESEFLHGKRLYVYTHPAGSEGGIFSKTYISIDENNVLNLRGVINSTKEAWTEKEEK